MSHILGKYFSLYYCILIYCSHQILRMIYPLEICFMVQYMVNCAKCATCTLKKNIFFNGLHILTFQFQIVFIFSIWLFIIYLFFQLKHMCKNLLFLLSILLFLYIYLVIRLLLLNKFILTYILDQLARYLRMLMLFLLLFNHRV